MATDATPAILRGLLVPDDRVSWGADAYSSALSTLTQAGPLPGVPEPQQASALALETSGSQSAGGYLKVRTIRGGHPDIEGAGLCWQDDGDADWCGWDAPQAISDFEIADLNATSGYWRHPHALRLADQTLALVATQQNQAVYCWVRGSDDLWTSAEVYDKGSAYSSGSAYPCLVQLPDGTLLCYHWVVIGGSTLQIRQQVSSDGGATWGTGQRSVLPAPGLPTATYVQGRIRVAYLNGQILMIVHLQTVASPIDQLHQYASNDLGNNFESIDALTDVSRAYQDMIVSNGRIVLAYLAYRASTTPNHLPYVRVLASAYEQLSAVSPAAVSAAGTVEWGTDSGGGNYYFTAGELALARDDDGLIYLYGREHDAGSGGRREVVVVRSTDDGASWESQGRDGSAPGTGATIWNGQDAAYYPLDLAAAAYQGRVVMLTRFNGGPAGDSLLAWYLGGYTSVTLPLQDAGYLSPRYQIGWERTWVPITSPHAYALFAQTTAGVITETLTASGYRLQHGSGAGRAYWSAAPATTLAQGLMALFHVKVVVGTVYLTLQISDGATTSYTVRVTLGATSIVLEDWGSGAAVTIDSASTAAATYGAQILIALDEGRVTAWYRTTTTVAVSARKWTLLGQDTSITAGALTTDRIEFGSIAGSSSDDFYFRGTYYTHGTYTGEQLAGGQENPAQLLPRGYSASPVWIDDGVRLAALDGPTFVGEQWWVRTRYTYGIERVHYDVASSPDAHWRSTSTASAAEIAWATGENAADVQGVNGGWLALYLGNINWKSGTLYGRDSGGSWVSLASISSAIATGLTYRREGATVRPDTGTSASRYFQPHELAGCYWASGGTPTVRKIKTNSSGAWRAGTAPAVRLQLDTYATGDGSSGSDGQLWASELVVLIPIAPGTAYSGYKLKIDAQATAEGYFRVGTILVGHVAVLGHPYGWGRAQTWAPIYEATELPSGVTQIRSRQVRTPREVEIDWSGDGVDLSQLLGATPDPDYVRAYTSSGPVVGARRDGPTVISGLIQQLRGAAIPTVYLPRIDVPASSSPITITDRKLLLYGRIVSEEYRLDTVLGDEGSSEVVRGGVVRLREVL